ncbi:MAG: hypothetical protein Q9219_003381 [cf. Caloplaca sp. 3 TL-2023]
MNDRSPAPSSLPSRTASPANGTVSSRSSIEVKREESGADLAKDRLAAIKPEEMKEQQTPDAVGVEVHAAQAKELKSTRQSCDSDGSSSIRPSLELSRTTSETLNAPKINGTSSARDEQTPIQYQQNMEQMRCDYEAAELRRQEETHMYLERIDALQSKLEYLTKEAAQMAKSARSDAEFGSIEEKLATKDEKIALLMEEGHKLSQTELKHMSIIKKLRSKATDDDKRIAETKKLSERYEKVAREAQEKARCAEQSERRVSEQAKSVPQLIEDLETMRADRDAKDAVIQDLHTQLADATSAARKTEEKAQAEALEVERKRRADLANELSTLKSDKEATERQNQAELRELREKSEREKERARVLEIERQNEQNILESRLESYRARAEENSVVSGGDIQAKLLRLIEMLQNQYTIASENWQGIEASLLARASALEKEKDETTKRETDTRRKARESNTRSRRAEEELERAIAKCQDLEYDASQRQSQLAAFHDKYTKVQAEADAARKELLAERGAWEAKKQTQQQEEDRLRQQDENFRTTPDTLEQQCRTDSPVTSGRKRKTSNTGKGSSLHNNRRLQGLAITGASAERPVSRRSPTQPFNHSSDHHHPLSRQGSMTFTTQHSVNGVVPETPSIQIESQEDFFDGIHTPATPERTINDMISVSTTGAGPSVQLVERMSAAVRRLESEKAAHKDELARLSAQRDEAREQIVGLMKEAEEKRAADAKAEKLQQEVEQLNARYLTTLEMLGEKSEKVDELMADVADLKEMYRELVDRTMK